MSNDKDEERRVQERVLTVMVRKRLIALNRYTEADVDFVVNSLKKHESNLKGAKITNDPKLVKHLDDAILCILDDEYAAQQKQNS